MFKAAGVETMEQCFNFAVSLHSHKRMVGTRKVLSEEDEMQPNGKMFQKWDMGDYSWKSYAEVQTKVLLLVADIQS
jgi:long-chain acyl-CoA synthetase